MSRYERMKLMCFFDLPTETSQERYEYRKFRQTLLKNGFNMVQYSVYMRTCPNREFGKKFIPKLKRMVPKSGSIRIMMITEKQYQDTLHLVGHATRHEEIVGKNRIIVI